MGMLESKHARSSAEYRTWQLVSVSIGGRSWMLATKPGVFANGTEDPGALLLAERATVEAGDVVLHMNCGNGLFGTVAASRGAARVVLTDRNVVAVEAARLTLAANGVERGEVLIGHGAHPVEASFRGDVVAIRIPHEKVALLQLMWDAFRVLKIHGRCYLAGATNEGIKSAARTLQRIFGNASVVATDSGHRIVVATKRAETPASSVDIENPYLDRERFHELSATLRGRTYTLSTRPGVFSWDHVDEATEVLANVMEVSEGQSVLDLGCGAGGLGIVAAGLSAGGRVAMVDADAEAVRAATRSAIAAGLTNFRVMTSDVASAVIDERFEVVVTNPPFHVGKNTDLDVPLQFIHEAWEVLTPGGRMFLVANRTLPYERAIRNCFENLATLHDGPRFKVLGATRQDAS